MEKENIVLLCGLLCKKIVWEEVAKELSKKANVSIISFEGCNSIEDMAKKVLDNSPQKFILIGHSMGGRVTLEVFNQQKDRLKAMGLFNTGVHPTTQTELPGRIKLLELAKNEGMLSVVKQWLPPMMGKEALENKSLVNELEKMVISYTPKEFSMQIEALINRPDARMILPMIDIPTLLLSSSEDNWSPISQHEKIQKQIPNSKLVEIENAGHMVICEKPEAIAKSILQWLDNQ